jgi:hypothetical protein
MLRNSGLPSTITMPLQRAVCAIVAPAAAGATSHAAGAVATAAFSLAAPPPSASMSPPELDANLQLSAAAGILGAQGKYGDLIPKGDGDCASSLPASFNPAIQQPNVHVSPGGLLRPGMFISKGDGFLDTELLQAESNEYVTSADSSGVMMLKRKISVKASDPSKSALQFLQGGHALQLYCATYRGSTWTASVVAAHSKYMTRILELHTITGYDWPTIAKLEDTFRVRMHTGTLLDWDSVTDLTSLMTLTLRTTTGRGAPSGAAAAGGGGSQGGGGSHDMNTTSYCHGIPICKNFNRGVPCTQGDSCRYKHVCYACNSSSHVVGDPACKKKSG